MNKRKKIFVIGCGTPYDRKGLFNAMLGRTRMLQNSDEYNVEFYLIGDYEPWLVRKLRGTPKRERIESVIVDGVRIKMLWFTYSILDYICHIKLHGRAYFKEYFLKKQHIHLKDADFIIAHSQDAGYVAMNAKKQYGIPFSVTWHGSDIHTAPWNSYSERKKITEIIKSADINYFVSNALCKLSDKLVRTNNKKVLHNGCDRRFIKYNDSERQKLRDEFHVSDKIVLSFAGNLIDIKNVLLLPQIFEIVHKHIANTVLWVFGSGKLKHQMEESSKKLPVVFWGDKSPDKMPDFLNCTNLLLLPSKNEGLPLVLVEALNCGCKAVGSNVGGIKEIIGAENVVNYPSNDFVEKFAEKVIYRLSSNEQTAEFETNDDFSWEHANLIEDSDIKRFI